jgi:hypothetical protein
MVTTFPASPAAGVYVKLNGDDEVEPGVTVPAPFSVIVTEVALPPKVFPDTVIGVSSHVEPDVELNVRVGGSGQLQSTVKGAPVVSHPVVTFLTVTVWLPSDTPVKTLEAWNAPPSN